MGEHALQTWSSLKLMMHIGVSWVVNQWGKIAPSWAQHDHSEKGISN